MVTTSDAESLPELPGAYLLVIRLTAPVRLGRRFDGLMLPEGCYGYAGNANGHGGIRARCRRHLAPRKNRHWHVDWLTSSACDINAAAFPGQSECQLIGALRALPNLRLPVPGFGSSDCRRCPTHLVRFDVPDAVEAVVRLLGSG